jgi:hypothetical protein
MQNDPRDQNEGEHSRRGAAQEDARYAETDRRDARNEAERKSRLSANRAPEPAPASPAPPKSFKPREETDLERRVLAHERVLTVLIAELARERPDLLLRLQEVFSPHPPLGAYEQDYTDTAGYADQFIHEAKRLWDAWDHRPR